LGCLDEVIGATRSCVTQADLFINGEHALTGDFPASGPYPGFCIILRRKVLDHILLRHAVAGGAAFRPGSVVKSLRWLSDRVVVEAVSEGAPVTFNAKIVIGADGANSMVSRALGNRIMEGATAVSLRGYYEGLPTGSAGIQIHFDEPFFPGYGWLFADDTGTANVGVGYAVDRDFPLRGNLHQIYQRFIDTNLRQSLGNARPAGPPKGGWSSFFRPATLVKERVLLIGDAATLSAAAESTWPWRAPMWPLRWCSTRSAATMHPPRPWAATKRPGTKGTSSIGGWAICSSPLPRTPICASSGCTCST
jgi:flavin-dependent dehydrogenase